MPTENEESVCSGGNSGMFLDAISVPHFHQLRLSVTSVAFTLPITVFTVIIVCIISCFYAYVKGVKENILIFYHAKAMMEIL